MHISKLKRFPNFLDTTYLTSGNDFLLHALRFEEQACQVLAFSISEGVEKRPFAPLIIESSQNFFFTSFQKPIWFYLPTTNVTC